MITLREINRDNFDDVINLSVFDEQTDFVASNAHSLAQAKAQPECVPLAIYRDNDLIGFVMYGVDFEDKEYWIYRIMIDKRHQNMGYGREAMQCVLSRLAQDTGHNKVYISFRPENAGAKGLYEKLGFIPDGRSIDGELVYCLHYTP